MKTKLFFVVAFVILSNTIAFAHTAMVTTIVIDSTASVSEEDFTQAKKAAVAFAAFYYKRSQLYPNRLADWLSINFFGDSTYFKGTPYIKCDNKLQILSCMRSVYGYAHPKCGSTAIYNAIGSALSLAIEKVNELDVGDRYLLNFIIITDGGDNDKSPQNIEMKQFVQSKFPKDVNLFVIGVGNDANINEFNSIADKVYCISNWSQLAATLLAVGEVCWK